MKTHGYTEIKNYVCNIPQPSYKIIKKTDGSTETCLLLNDNICDLILKKINELT